VSKFPLCIKGILKLLQQNIQKILDDIVIAFPNGTPAAQEIRVRIDKWDSIKLKSFRTKEPIARSKRQPRIQNGRESFPDIHQTKD
jgi:hypothetical protein